MNAAPIWVFAGPSLPPLLRPPSGRFAWRPPALAGDGVAALQASAAAVVLIDGLFDLHPAIRHKELLMLIDAGVPVIGGASMGALRAAELHTLGMIGVGAVFQAYAAGRLTGDDEVALLHGPQEMDWAALTLPMVNVRATLARAVRSRILDVAEARKLRALAGEVFFQDRTWASLLDAAGPNAAAARRLADWARGGGYVDQKRQDALACLAIAAALPAGSRGHVRPSAETAFTAALIRQVGSGPRPTSASSWRPR